MAARAEVNTSLTTVVSRLRPYMLYMVSLQATNAVGTSERSEPSHPLRTLQAGFLKFYFLVHCLFKLRISYNKVLFNLILHAVLVPCLLTITLRP